MFSFVYALLKNYPNPEAAITSMVYEVFSLRLVATLRYQDFTVYCEANFLTDCFWQIKFEVLPILTQVTKFWGILLFVTYYSSRSRSVSTVFSVHLLSILREKEYNIND
jgi:ABC-type transporter Mla maintaining outer membrane lipid asymmetry permease subunit MlaE